MKVLVTGGSGFIGSHLAETLLDSGHQVVVVDDFSTGQKSNLADFTNNDRFDVHEIDVNDENAVEPFIHDADIIFHLAAAVGVKFIVNNPIKTLQTNTKSTENILKLATLNGKKRVILASTSEVYGDSREIPFREDSNLLIGPPDSPRWGYACSKLMDEFLAAAYHQEYGLPVVILRLFNTVGPRQLGHYGMVLPTFIAQALEQSPITVYGDGKQTRSFTWVKDVVHGMIQISQVESAEGQIFNLGSGNEIEIKELANLVKEVLGSSSEIVYLSTKEAYGIEFQDVRHRLPDISKIQRYIDYKPSSDLIGIIEDIATHLKAH